MRKMLARFLRRLAQRLAPQLAAEPAETPMEFRTTLELAEIIRARSDCAVVLFGRDRACTCGCGGNAMNATLIFGLKPSHADPAVPMIVNALAHLEEQ